MKRGKISSPFKKKSLVSFRDFIGLNDSFPEGEELNLSDPYKIHSWVNICIGILMRNIGRATFRITRDGDPIETGPIYELFRDVNPQSNRFDLWKETAAWWFLEGEVFWYFGTDYTAGIPREIHILNPRKMRAFIPDSIVTKWFYSTAKGEIPILPDEIIHFKEWNPWNPHRGVTPLIALNHEIEQDVRTNRTTSDLLRNGAVPEGLLKTDQVLREEEADRLEKRWAQSYGRSREAKRIAVLGKGTQFQPLSITPAAMKYFEMKRWNLYTLLAKYGIPPRVAQIQDSHSSLSGTDTAGQHGAFWKFTIIPTLKNFEQILETQFFTRFGLSERGVFDTSEIPELQESADSRSQRDIKEIEAGLKTINDVLRERGQDPKPWGDVWHNNPSANKEHNLKKMLKYIRCISDSNSKHLYSIKNFPGSPSGEWDDIAATLKNHCSNLDGEDEDLEELIYMLLTQTCLLSFHHLKAIYLNSHKDAEDPPDSETLHEGINSFPGINTHRKQSRSSKDGEGDPAP